jgi:hypothetical protein
VAQAVLPAASGLIPTLGWVFDASAARLVGLRGFTRAFLITFVVLVGLSRQLSAQGPTNSLGPVIVTPVCEGTHTVSIQGTDRDAIVVLFHNGSAVARTRGTGADAVIDLGDRSFQFGDRIQAAQYVGDAIGPRSQLVFVDCGNVTTQHNDNARSGNYRVETQLTPANVRSVFGRRTPLQTFGRLYKRHVDGDIVAQPLYMRGVHLRSGGTRNLFFIATSTNNVYAFDADDRSAEAGAVWNKPLCRSVHSAMCDETKSGFVGITSTPVIDPISKIMYVVARCSDGTGGPQDGAIWIHALDITDDNNRPEPITPAEIKADYNGKFNPHCQRNRPGLLLQNGIVYVGFGGFSCDSCDETTRDPFTHKLSQAYRGWVIGYRADNLQQVAAFATNSQAGIWQTGNGLVGAPDGSIFFETGNGPVSEPLQNSFVKLVPIVRPPGLAIAGHKAPNNASIAVYPGGRSLSEGDTDFGSGGPLLLPGGRLIGGGKQGRYYVLDQLLMDWSQNKTPDAWGFDVSRPSRTPITINNSHTSHVRQCMVRKDVIRRAALIRRPNSP